MKIDATTIVVGMPRSKAEAASSEYQPGELGDSVSVISGAGALGAGAGPPSSVVSLATMHLAHAALSSDSLLGCRDKVVGHSVSAAVLRPLGVLSAALRSNEWVATLGRTALESPDPLVQSRVRIALRSAFHGDTAWAQEVAKRTGKAVEFIEGTGGASSSSPPTPSVPGGGVGGDKKGRWGGMRGPPKVFVDVVRNLDALVNGEVSGLSWKL
jgi:hypothetical protein